MQNYILADTRVQAIQHDGTKESAEEIIKVLYFLGHMSSFSYLTHVPSDRPNFMEPYYVVYFMTNHKIGPTDWLVIHKNMPLVVSNHLFNAMFVAEVV